MKLHDLMNKGLLGQMMDKGYIHLQVHPSEPLGILNYTDKAAWEGVWNEVTLTCRGLIYDMTNYDVLARPFAKFFNYEQLGPAFVFPSGPVEVTDKQDGSLGILYPLPGGGWAVATRGSFASDQALHATRLLNDGLLYPLTLDRDITYLFEIIYPENRIVLNYGDMDELVLLGGVNIETGLNYTPSESRLLLNWNGPTTRTFDVHSFADALALPPRDNAEGIVVYFHSTGQRVKLKQADYVALHRIVTGMTDRSVWEALAQGKTTDQIKEPLPEEFWPWVDEVANNLFALADQILLTAHEAYTEILYELDSANPEFTRKDFAIAVKDIPSPLKGYLFKYLDGQSIWPVVWRSIKPEAVRSLVTASLEE